ncbi:hypothetical protein F443_09996 [Phytophthora nicotianae P1569]|uniref:Uncharacterized protein n=1 Tax=Phytophthora nicotianae P1569 TaxID=1317065 RepID=V9F3X6_PHYNI|nr:hypothetical protein F443_09996 [Phytophthora nicotianae P1569]
MVDPYISTFNRLRQAIGGTGAACVLALPVVDVAALTAPVLMAGAVTTSAIGTGSVAAPVVATCAIGAKAVVVGGALGTAAVAAIVVGSKASDKDVPPGCSGFHRTHAEHRDHRKQEDLSHGQSRIHGYRLVPQLVISGACLRLL